MKTSVVCVIVLAGLWLGAAGGVVHAKDGLARARDPLASRPMGPFSLLTNPAAVVEEKALGLHLGFQPGDDQEPLRFIAYSDPGNGLFAAGALIWLEGGKTADSKWRQFSYHIGRFLTERVAVGVGIKHIASPHGERWAGDLGLYMPIKESLQLGVVYYNAFGATDHNPDEVVASVSYLSLEGWAFSVEVGTPLSSSQLSSLVSWVLDVPLGSGSVLRAGHRRYHGDDSGTEWLGALHWELGNYALETSVVWPHQSPAVYRIGVRLSF